MAASSAYYPQAAAPPGQVVAVVVGRSDSNPPAPLGAPVGYGGASPPSGATREKQQESAGHLSLLSPQPGTNAAAFGVNAPVYASNADAGMVQLTMQGNQAQMGCERACWQLCCTYTGVTLLCLLILTVWVLFIEPYTGLIVMAIVPSVWIQHYAYKVFQEQATRGLQLASFFEACLWMIPLFVLIAVAISPLDEKTNDVDDAYCGLCIVKHLIMSFFVTGTLEEMIKYAVIRRHASKDYILDFRTLVVVAISAGAGFATVENIGYVLLFGISTAYMRAFVSVPLHCSTGIFMALNLAQQRVDKTLEDGNFFVTFARSMWKAILMHGLFNFCLFLGDADRTPARIGYFFAAMVVYGLFMWHLRTLYVMTNNTSELNENSIHELLAAKQVSLPGAWVDQYCCCFCECPWYFT